MPTNPQPVPGETTTVQGGDVTMTELPPTEIQAAQEFIALAIGRAEYRLTFEEDMPPITRRGQEYIVATGKAALAGLDRAARLSAGGESTPDDWANYDEARDAEVDDAVELLFAVAQDYEDSAYALKDTPGMERIAGDRSRRGTAIRDLIDRLPRLAAGEPEGGTDAARLLAAIADYGWCYNGGLTFTANLTSIAEAKRLSHLFDRALSRREDETSEPTDTQRGATTPDVTQATELLRDYRARLIYVNTLLCEPVSDKNLRDARKAIEPLYQDALADVRARRATLSRPESDQ